MWYCFDFRGTNTTPSDRAAVLGYSGQSSPGTKLRVRMGLPLYPWHWWHRFYNPRGRGGCGCQGWNGKTGARCYIKALCVRKQTQQEGYALAGYVCHIT